jgi:hypothetical protein
MEATAGGTTLSMDAKGVRTLATAGTPAGKPQDM